MQLKVNNPNMSVILPVGCNAKCSFCCWEQSSGLTPDIFKDVSTKLPSIFKQVSITGGETTLDPNLINYLKIARKRFEKVVLNTNGHKLEKEHFKYLDHVNISRHHWKDSLNEEVFKTDSIPNAKDLKELCSYGDVTINCVLEDGFSDSSFIDSYIKFAKEIGAKVAFRKYFNNIDILKEVDKDETLKWEHKCPACLNRGHIINGVDVTFKYSVQETFEAMDGIYEVILHPNGKLAIDWQGKKILEYKEDKNVDI